MGWKGETVRRGWRRTSLEATAEAQVGDATAGPRVAQQRGRGAERLERYSGQSINS